MIVCIAEKPGVAHELARILGANRRCEGYDEGNGYQVTWTYGHLCELKYPEDYRPEWRRWSLAALPMIPPRFGIRLKQDAGIEKQFRIIEKLFASAERIVNCGDAGQEGELRPRWVMQKAGAKCPVDRLWTSSMTEEAIREGFASLREQSRYDGLYRAGLCRAIGDWLLGMNATRLYTLKYGRTGQGLPPLSIGRVQTPTLALIVQRQQEIDNFRPEPYWVLSTRYRDTLFTAVMEEGERGFRTEAEGADAVARVAGELFRITDVQRKNGSEAPPRLFDLTGLQVECNRKFGYSAEQTLALIQTLYEKKLTTYPRVDTTYLPDDVYGQCKKILNGIAADYAACLAPLRGSALRKSRKVFDNAKVTDHHAIIPTGVAARGLTDAERNVYDMVALRFIAAFHADCRFVSTTVTGEAGGVAFRTTGRVVTDEGWRMVYAREAKTAADNSAESGEDKTLPAFRKGEEGPHEPVLEQKTTQPPKPYTEAGLLRAMETAGRTVDDEELREALKANGIGRPSTRAAIIETLFKRGYVRRQRKSLVPTPTGTELIGLIREDLLKSAELTGRWEKKLREIETGDYDAARFVDELKEMVQGIVTQVLADCSNRRVTAQAVEPLPPVLERARRAEAAAASAPKAPRVRAGSKCPLCGKGKVIKGKTAYGCSRWKEGCAWRKPFGK